METAPYIAPRGYLPESTDAVKAQAWTTDATTRVTALVATNSTARQQAMDAWVYYRGFSYWAEALGSAPLEATVGVQSKVSRKFDLKQLERFEERAKFWLNRYRDLLAELGVTDTEAEALRDHESPKVYSQTSRGWKENPWIG